MTARLAHSRPYGAFAKSRPVLVCSITAADGGIATIPDAPAGAPVTKL